MELYSLIAATLLVKFFQETAAILIVRMALDTGLTCATIQGGIALQSTSYAISSFLLIILNDLLGNIRTLRYSTLAILIASATIACTANPCAIYASRLLLGLGMGGLNCSAYVQIRRITPDARLGQTLSFAYVALFSSAMAYSAIGGYFQSYWREFFVTSALGASLLLYATRTLSCTTHTEITRITHNDLALLRQPAFVRCCLTTCITLGHTYGLQSFVAAYHNNIAAIDQGLLQCIGRIGMVVMTWLFAYLRTPLVRVASIGSLIIGLGLICMLSDVWLKTGVLLSIGFVTSYCAIGITQTAMKTEMFMLLHAHPSLAQGVMSGTGLLWDALTGAMIWQLPWSYGIYAFIVATLACVTGILLLARQTPTCARQSTEL
jgi:predicted MFS family arabinose efflux permease